MLLPEVFATVRPAVVAFMPTVIAVPQGGKRPDLFPIIGTGFVLADGLIVTNAHVIDALLSLPRPPDWPADRLLYKAVLFHFLDKEHFPNIPVDGYAEIPLEVLGVFTLGDLKIEEGGIYYGPRRPDFSIVHVKAKGLPRIELHENTALIKEGMEVASVGFPLGTDALTAPGWLHQLCPFLQRGVISAILPFACKAPHAFAINIMSLGGASGSPVFLTDDPKAIGILNSGLMSPNITFTVIDGKRIPVGATLTPTNFSYVVPAYLLSSCLDRIKSDAAIELPAGTLSLDEMIQRASFTIAKESGHNEPPDPSKLSLTAGDAPSIQVRIEPTSRPTEN